MGNAPPAAGVQSQLRLCYLGPTLGSLPKDQHGAIQANHLDPVTSEARPAAIAIDLADRLFSSLGPLEKLPRTPPVTMEKAMQGEAPESITLVHPMNPNYVPFFSDRQSEYGKGHTYYEALCHALPSFDLVASASARFFRRNGTAVITAHLPATLPIIGFIEALRVKNKPFLAELEKQLKEKESTLWSPVEGAAITPSEAIQRFIEGAFRNVAIQLHFKGGSRDRAALMHMDHVFSSLHMGVTLHGERSVGFALPDFNPNPMEAQWPPAEVTLPMRKGDVYVTTPAAILHGVSTQALSESERSVAIQCRTMLDGPSAQFWNAYKTPLNGLVAKLLAERMIIMPSLEEVKRAEDEIMALWKAKLPNPPETFTIPMFDDQ